MLARDESQISATALPTDNEKLIVIARLESFLNPLRVGVDRIDNVAKNSFLRKQRNL